jgi:hypothetical protein
MKRRHPRQRAGEYVDATTTNGAVYCPGEVHAMAEVRPVDAREE